jgi:hypothetical protein
LTNKALNILKLIGRTAIVCLVFTLSSGHASAQFTDDFGSGILNPEWQGDRENFVITDNGQLRLNAPEAGVSWLFRETNFPKEFSLSMFFRMDFAPSNTNQARIYFMLDKSDLSSASGYYFQLGENGNDDAIRLFRLSNGAATQLSSGTLGAIASSPAQANFRLDYTENGLWSLSVDYEGTQILIPDMDVFDDSFLPESGSYFGIYCVYTSTRTDLFYFDNISLRPFEEDSEGPELVRINIPEADRVALTFNKALDNSSALNPENYTIDNGIIIVENVQANTAAGVTLSLNQSLSSSRTYTLSINGVSDLFGNEATQDTFLFYPRPAKQGDLLLSEILADPETGISEFIEVYNPTNDFLNLQGITIFNIDRNISRVIQNYSVIDPNDYLAITDNIEAIKDFYNPPQDANFLRNDIPGMNIASGNVSLFAADGSLPAIDSFNYRNDMHNPFIRRTKGVSLERIDFGLDTNSPGVWQSASSLSNFATPGYKNSNNISNEVSEEEFFLVKKTFSPNNDGMDDVLLLRYNLNEPGFLANIRVFDSNGNMVKILSQNELLGTEGLITWNGENESGMVERIGIYILAGEVFNSNGIVKSLKRVCVLADFLD